MIFQDDACQIFLMSSRKQQDKLASFSPSFLSSLVRSVDTHDGRGQVKI